MIILALKVPSQKSFYLENSFFSLLLLQKAYFRIKNRKKDLEKGEIWSTRTNGKQGGVAEEIRVIRAGICMQSAKSRERNWDVR